MCPQLLADRIFDFDLRLIYPCFGIGVASGSRNSPNISQSARAARDIRDSRAAKLSWPRAMSEHSSSGEELVAILDGIDRVYAAGTIMPTR